MHSRNVLRIPVASLAIRWSLIGLAAMCALGLLALVFIVALEKEIDAWSRIALFAIAISACVATFLVSPPEWDPADIPGSFAKPKFLAVVIAALFVSFEMTSNAVGVFATNPVDNDQPKLVEEIAKDTNRRVRQLEVAQSSNAKLFLELNGLWGESGGCETAYKFTIVENALTVEAVRRPVGASSWKLIAAITSVNGNSIDVVGESPAKAKGRAARFTYEDNGPIDRLIWDDKSLSTRLELEKCH